MPAFIQVLGFAAIHARTPDHDNVQTHQPDRDLRADSYKKRANHLSKAAIFQFTPIIKRKLVG
jgi:hypothetical protein